MMQSFQQHALNSVADGAPLVSIIIDNYNYGRFLREAVDSALAQTHRNTEVIVVDDGSTDDSRNIIASYGNRVVPLLKSNGGQASAFNAGFAASRGDIVLFLDADDVLLSSAVENALPHFADQHVVKVHWPFWLVDEHCRKTGYMFPGLRLPEGDCRDVALRLGPTNHVASGLGAAWSRAYLDCILPMSEQIYRTGADTYLFELAPFFGTLKAIQEPQALYRQHGKNDHTSLNLDQRIRRELAFYEDFCSVLKRHYEGQGVDVDLPAWQRNSWWHKHEIAIQEIAQLLDPGSDFILVDDGTWEPGLVAGRRPIPFLERDGVYWGPPSDDENAIHELQQVMKAARFIVF